MKKIKYIAIILIISIISVFVCSCKKDETEKTYTRDFVSMDASFSIRMGDVAENTDKTEAKDIESLFDECEKLADEIEMVLSASVDGAEVNSFNKNIDTMLDADPILCDVLTTALRIFEVTGGAYDPVLGALTSLWNVENGGPVPDDDSIKAALSLSGAELITLDGSSIVKSDSGVMLDMDGIAKGYAAQKIAEKLYSSGVSHGIVTAGRTVGVFGEKPDGSPFKIGISDPDDSSKAIGYIYTEGGFLSVAGDREEFFEEGGKIYHHIIDPETGYPCDSGLSGVAVLSQNGATADALSTALLVMGYEDGMKLYESDEIPFEAVFIFSDGTVKKTAGLTDERFVLSETEAATK